MSSPSTILVADDDKDVLIAAKMALNPIGAHVETLNTPETMFEALSTRQPGAVLLDMNFAPGLRGGAEGLDWLRKIQTLDPALSVVLMTAYGGVALAVETIKRGAVDFVLKPWQNEKLVATMSAALALSQARREAAGLTLRNHALATATHARPSNIIGSAPALLHVFGLLQRAAPTDANILILGESGTGKELAAREIHRLSARANQPFISVDLGEVPENLFESELFGHKRGAFTGATSDRTGRIQAAHGGTLFLDEIGNLPLHLQRKLLSVLERREVLPVGSPRPVPIDIRLVTATNRPASDLTREELFRRDLLYRIKTVEVVLPPLRDRREDIPALLEHFLAFFARKHNIPRPRPSPETLGLLEAYDWPGNVRELRHAVERAVILASSERLVPDDFPFLTAGRTKAVSDSLDLESIELQAIERALALHHGNISLAASALGLSRPALYRRIAKHGL